MRFLHDLYLGQAAGRSGDLAVVDSAGAHTYAALQASALAWRDELVRVGTCRGDRVVLLAQTSFESIACLLGCSMAGAIFSVISPELPASRLNKIIDNVEPFAIVAATPWSESPAVSFQQRGTIGDYQIHARQDVGARKGRVSGHQIDTDPAYIVFTSGSTGMPKGIVMSHRAVVCFLRGLIDHLNIAGDMRYATVSPLQFDLSLIDIGLTLGTGSTLFALPRKLLLKSRALVGELKRYKVTHFSSVPTVWQMLLTEKFSPDDLSSLQCVLFAGEHFPKDTLLRIESTLPNVTFVNIYGQSESMACAAHVVTGSCFDSNGHLPIGYGHPDMELFLLDQQGRTVDASGQMGELHIKGTPLFSSYWRQPTATAERLIPDPRHCDYRDLVFRTGDNCYRGTDGLLYFAGRSDNQVKVHGNRVELEDIESALYAVSRDVTDGCVFASRHAEQLTVHAAIVWSPNATVLQAAAEQFVRSKLAEALPSYMWPDRYHFVDRIPTSTNGKKDRAALAASLAEAGSPRT